MLFQQTSGRCWALRFFLLLSPLLPPMLTPQIAMRAQTAPSAVPDPWTPRETLEAADLARELIDTQKPQPIILYVGVRALFNGGHIPGSTFHGTTSTEKGLAEMQAYARTLPRAARLVLYCGCCPLARCPNIRPAYSALQEMGFTNIRVLILPVSFAADWAEKGFPVEKGHGEAQP